MKALVIERIFKDGAKVMRGNIIEIRSTKTELASLRKRTTRNESSESSAERFERSNFNLAYRLRLERKYIVGSCLKKGE